jgi:large subunit ribosomal protein L22
MISYATSKFIRGSARKMRLVATLVRYKAAQEALATLENSNKRHAAAILKTLKSALANAKTKTSVNPQDLYISKLTIDAGPMLKRYRAMSFGRAGVIRKRTSHIHIELDLKNNLTKKRK